MAKQESQVTSQEGQIDYGQSWDQPESQQAGKQSDVAVVGLRYRGV